MREPYLFKDPVFVEVDDMVEPQQRYMSMNINNDMIEELIEHFEEGKRIHRGIVAKTVGRGVSVSENCISPRLGRKQEQLNIRRFRFYLMIVENEPTRSVPGVAYIVTGFTSEISNEDLEGVHGDTELFISSVIELRSKLASGRRGDEIRYDISKMQVVQRKDFSGEGRGSRGRTNHNGRVSDILTIYGVASTGEIDLDEDDDVLITSSEFGRRATSSGTLSDQSRASYINRLMTADRLGMAETRTWSDDDDDDYGRGLRRYTNAADMYSSQSDLSRYSGLISWLSSRSIDIKNTMSFRYDDLIDLVPNRNPTFDDLDDMTCITPICDDNDVTYYSQEFYGKSSKMRSIAIMCQEIPVFMSETLLTRVEFTVDNESLDRDGNPEYCVNDFDLVFKIDGIDDMVDLFIRRFIAEVYLQATNDNKRYLYLKVCCSIGGLVEIEMEYEGNDPEEFRFPAFMLGILSNNTSYDVKDTYRLAQQYGRVSQDFITRVVFNEEEDDDEISSRLAKAFED